MTDFMPIIREGKPGRRAERKRRTGDDSTHITTNFSKLHALWVGGEPNVAAANTLKCVWPQMEGVEELALRHDEHVPERKDGELITTTATSRSSVADSIGAAFLAATDPAEGTTCSGDTTETGAQAVILSGRISKSYLFVEQISKCPA